MQNAIPILSLVVAALAVFVGPIISWKVTKRQITSSLAVANKQIVAPMRQVWISNLRDILAELTSSAFHYYLAGFEERTDEEYLRVTLLQHKAAMMLNPLEEDHRRLEDLIRQLISSLDDGLGSDLRFPGLHKDVADLSRQVLKREWNCVTNKIQAV